MRWLRQFLKAVLPSSVVNWLRRWVATGRYVRYMSQEVYGRQYRLERDSPLETLESRLALRHDGFYKQMVKEVVERTDLVLQQLDRRLEGQGARQSERLRALEQEMAGLRRSVEDLRAAVERSSPAAGPSGPRRSRQAEGRSGGGRRRVASE